MWNKEAEKKILKEAIERGLDVKMGVDLKFSSGNIIYGNQTVLQSGRTIIVLAVVDMIIDSIIRILNRLARDLYPNGYVLLVCPYERIKRYHLGEMLSKTRVHKPEEIWDKIEELKERGIGSSIEIGGFNNEDVYPMCPDQRKEIQMDCRVTACTFYAGDGDCDNPAPAITLNPDRQYICHSMKEREVDE